MFFWKRPDAAVAFRTACRIEEASPGSEGEVLEGRTQRVSNTLASTGVTNIAIAKLEDVYRALAAFPGAGSATSTSSCQQESLHVTIFVLCICLAAFEVAENCRRSQRVVLFWLRCLVPQDRATTPRPVALAGGAPFLSKNAGLLEGSSWPRVCFGSRQDQRCIGHAPPA